MDPAGANPLDQVLQALWHQLYEISSFPLFSARLTEVEEFFFSLLNPADLESLKDAVQGIYLAASAHAPSAEGQTAPPTASAVADPVQVAESSHG